jgi:hypothetical protein
VSVTVEIPMALPSASNLREHWGAKRRRVKSQRVTTGLMLRANRVADAIQTEHVGEWAIARPLVVTLTRIGPRSLDDDNLRGAFKAVRDEVAAYFGVDDSDPRIKWRYAQAKGRAAVRIAFEVRPLDEAVRALGDLREEMR